MIDLTVQTSCQMENMAFSKNR